MALWRGVSSLLRIWDLDPEGCPLTELPIQKRQASERSNMESQLVQLLSNKLVFLTRLSDSLISGTSLLPCISGCVQITLTCYKLKHIPL